MPSRELQYRVVLNTSQAQGQARQIRSVIERELRQITLGQIDTRGLQTAQAEARALRQELDGAADEAERLNRVQKGGGGKKDSGLLAGVAAYLTINVAKQVEATARAFAEGNTEIKRANVAFVELAGGALQAQGRLIGIQQGAAGAVSQLEAIKIANQGASLGLASTAEQFQKLTEAARVTALISPVINDIGSAISELGLAAANLSFRRLDQLGLSVSEVRDRMRALQQANAGLSDSQAFLEASIDALTKKGERLLSSQAAQASGVERFNVAINEFLDQEGAFSNAIEGGYGYLADRINVLLTLLNLGSDKTVSDSLSARVDELKAQITDIQEAKRLLEQNQGIGIKDFFGLGNAPTNFTGLRAAAESKGGLDALEAETRRLLNGFQVLDAAFKVANQDIVEGEQGALAYRAALRDITVALERGSIGFDDIAGAVSEANKEYKAFQDTLAGTAGADAILSRYGEDKRRADEAVATILDESRTVEQALSKRAEQAAGQIGAEAAIELLRKQKEELDRAVQTLIESGVQDSEEISIRIAEITQQMIDGYGQMAEAAAGVDINFGGVQDALANFDQPFIDFLPGLDSLRDQLVDLQTEIAFTGTITAEQAAELDYLSSAAALAGGEAAALNAITAELGISFLAENEAAAAVVDQMYLASAAYVSGSITAEQYAGIISALGGQLLAYAQQAGVATDATLAFVNSLAGFSGTAGFTVGAQRGGAIAQRIETADQERQRRAARAEAERAAKAAAREQENAAKRAARELEQGAKKAAQELQGALRNVPGLFGRSPITEKDFSLTKAGVYQDQADEYLRRLQAEVEQGKDLFGDVSIEDAKSALRDLGVQVADDSKVAFQQFVDAWESGLLFFDPANIARFINEEAVQRSLDLQEKAKIGQENIFKAFGAAIDDYAASASAGVAAASAGTGGVSVPTTASLIPANGSLTAIPTLGGMSSVLDVAAIQGQLDGLTIKPTIDLSALSDADLTGALDAFGQRVAEQVKTSIATEIGTTRFDGEVIAPIADGLLRAINTEFSTQGQRFRDEGEAVATLLKTSLASAIGTTTWDDTGIVAPVASGLLTAINTEFRGATDAIKREGSGIAITLRYGIAQAIATTEWSDSGIVGGIASGLITAINTDFRANNEAFQREGASIAAPILAGLSNSFGQSDNQAFDVAGGMLTLLSTQFDEKQNMFYATGQTPAMNVISGFKTTLGGNEETNKGMIDPLLFGMTNAIRAREEDFRQRGATVAQAVLTGFTAQFDGEGFKNTLIAAGETMASYLEIGILAGISGIADAIGAQIVDDITNTVEEPTP